jgi:hypothetical protein
MAKRLNIGICVPTIRSSSLQEFVDRWRPFWVAAAESHYAISLFIHEDRDSNTFPPPCLSGITVRVTCWRDIDEMLGGRSWIIPRRSGASRSFPLYLAWKAGSDYVVALDDDCYPEDNCGGAFLADHLAAFQAERWFQTIEGEYPRGYPYGDRGRLPVLLNHGLWTAIPDLDGPTSLVLMRSQSEHRLRPGRDVVAPGVWFPLCAMNVCYSREALPAAYNLLMGVDDYGFDRFDDIWSGLFLKKIADHLKLYITSGWPVVRHVKASNPFANTRKEALGIEIHEYLWKYVDAVQLTETTVAGCYKEIAGALCSFAPPVEGLRPAYFCRLAEAMSLWLSLFGD